MEFPENRLSEADDSYRTPDWVAVEKAIKTARVRLLYPPKYSPDLNPIEILK
jgi:transposase